MKNACGSALEGTSQLLNQLVAFPDAVEISSGTAVCVAGAYMVSEFANLAKAWHFDFGSSGGRCILR